MAAVRIKAAIARSCRSVMQLTRSICYLETLVKWETPPVRSAYEKLLSAGAMPPNRFNEPLSSLQPQPVKLFFQHGAKMTRPSRSWFIGAKQGSP